MKRYAVILAGGKGVRMGTDIPKQFLEIAGKPVLRHVIERFLEFDSAVELVLVLPGDQREYWKDYCRRSAFLGRYSLAAGGITRFHSMKNALKYVGDEGLVAIHDGVRPMISTDLIDRLFSAAAEHKAAIPVVPLTDSVRRLGDDGSSPVDRTGLLAVQTPQVFEAGILHEAYGQAFRPSFTDDASVVEAAGHKIHLVPGERLNLKITTPEDLHLADSLVRISSSSA